MNVQNLRETYGRTLVELGAENPNIVVLEGDLGKSTMSCYFEEAFPNRYFEMGIAEANMTSFAGGLSLTGKIPFTNSFAAFAAGRAYDQIRQGLCLPNLNVKIVGSSAGLSDYGDGSTHQTVEDIAIMRAIPNLTVLVPSDAIETRKMVRAMAAHHGPVYMRVTRTDLPDVFPEDQDFVIGKPYLIRDGKDVVVFANGAMVSKALEAADLAIANNLSIRVVNVSSLKPVDEMALRDLAQGMRGIVTAEEHSVIGGLASIITYVFRKSGLPIECVGIEDRFGQSAENVEVLFEEYGLTSKHIVDAATSVAGAGA
ncbi:MAG TPA: transketolase C-terminal domain-containing protein [Telmatospirillum sp.]|nr:transketolase C-terminal domain-containing protein [Telmatospirillum sp.]